MSTIHPDDESLIAYLGNQLDNAADQAIESHLAICDLCVASARAAHARLLRLPAFVQSPAALPSQRVVTRTTGTRSRMSVLIPVSFAAGLLLSIGVRPWLGETVNVIRLRSTDPFESTRFVRSAAWIYQRPETGAAVLRTVQPGQALSIVGSEGNWLQIALPDGTHGWVEQRVVE